MQLDQDEVQERLEALQAQAALRGIELPARTTDILGDLEVYETALPNTPPMKAPSTNTTNTTNSQQAQDIQSLGQGYDKLPIESRTRLMSENGASLREAILQQERQARLNPALN